MKNTIITIFGLLLLLGACKEEDCCDASNPDCSNYDPCYGYPERPADFEMHALLKRNPNKEPYHSKLYDNDILYHYNTVRLSALYPNADSYEWQIGNEGERREGKNINVFFGYPYGEVALTLYVTYSESVSCFSSYNHKDSITKKLHLSSEDDLPIWGVFKGSYEHAPLDSFSFSLYQVGGSFPHMWGLPQTCGAVDSIDSINKFNLGARESVFNDYDHPACDRANGKWMFSEDYNQIKVMYDTTAAAFNGNYGYNYSHKIFNGIREN